ncbi:hypothetical protein ACK3Z9_20120, partial [Aeromonas caviae]
DKIRSQTKPFSYLFQLVAAKDPVYEELIALFELKIENDQIKVVEERHYKLVPANELDRKEVSDYRL